MDIVWRYGNIVCKAYPLLEIDSIREEDGGLNPCSVLAEVVYGVRTSILQVEIFCTGPCGLGQEQPPRLL